MTIDELAALVQADCRAYLSSMGYDSQIAGEITRVVRGARYVKIDRGPAHNMSGFLMIDPATGEIFGIKGYGRIHRGHRYGTLAEAQDMYWGYHGPAPRADIPFAPAG